MTITFLSTNRDYVSKICDSTEFIQRQRHSKQKNDKEVFHIKRGNLVNISHSKEKKEIFEQPLRSCLSSKSSSEKV